MITFHKGTSRYVVCIPFLGIVLKFPIVHFKYCYFVITNYGMRCGKLKKMFANSVYNVFSVRGQLFRGIVENWNEFSFYEKTKHQFLQPTYFSLFGFINVQKMGNRNTLSLMDHWAQISTMTKQEACCDGHHFSEPCNFCLDNGILKILDYGNPKTQKIITKFGVIIQENYDINFSWEKSVADKKSGNI